MSKTYTAVENGNYSTSAVVTRLKFEKFSVSIVCLLLKSALPRHPCSAGQGGKGSARAPPRCAAQQAVCTSTDSASPRATGRSLPAGRGSPEVRRIRSSSVYLSSMIHFTECQTPYCKLRRVSDALIRIHYKGALV